MKKLILSAWLLIHFVSVTLSQLAITTDGSDAHKSAMLEIKSTNKGLLIPRISTTAIVQDPAKGLMVFQTLNPEGFYYYNGTTWKPLGGVTLPPANGETTLTQSGDNVILGEGNFVIGTYIPDPSAALEINSTTQGLLPPRMTEEQRNAIESPAEGLVVYNTSTKKLNVYDGSNWIEVGSNTGSSGSYTLTGLGDTQISSPANNSILQYNSSIGKWTNALPGSVTSSLIGEIKTFAGLESQIPNGWVIADGRSLLRSKYPELFQTLNTSWGAADELHFNIPDFRGQFLRGVDGEANIDADKTTRTAKYPGGNTANNIGSFQEDELKNHNHSFSPGFIGAANNGTRWSYWSGNKNGTEYKATGNSGGTETRPKNAYVYFIIKISGSTGENISSSGDIAVGNSGIACSSSNEGSIRYNSTIKNMEFCDGTNWVSFQGGSSSQTGINNISYDLSESSTSQYTNMNLYQTVGSPTEPVNLTFTIPSNVTIGSASTSKAALIISGFPIGSTIKIINHGNIIGKGGKGGNGGYRDANGSNGSTGGDAIYSECNLRIYNNGLIGGGGGGAGGGGGGATDSAYPTGGGGGGGAGFSGGAGGNGGKNGGAGSITTGGNGGARSNAGTNTNFYAGAGGKGGNLGNKGSAGYSGRVFNGGYPGGGAGGNAGKAINRATGSVTWIDSNGNVTSNKGDVRGAS